MEDVIIIGAGLVGLTTALACAYKKASVTLIDAVDPKSHLNVDFDGRASAIAASSFLMFKHLDIAEKLGTDSQPITDILISDGELSKGMSPLNLHFSSESIGSDPMGYMIENRLLRRTLLETVTKTKGIKLMAPANIISVGQDAQKVSITLSNGQTLHSRMLAAADGRNSFVREHIGINVTRIPYKQKAIVTTVVHEKPHNGVAHELFFPSGPFAILPLTHNRSNIVWSDSPRAVDAAMAVSEKAFREELTRRFGNMYGEVGPCAPRWSYDLSMQLSERYVNGRIALVGDAAHAIHPIAGQGLNMGLRDAAALADIVEESQKTGQDIGTGIGQYQTWRRFDNSTLAGTTDLLNRLFSTRFGPTKHGRRVALGLIQNVSPAKKFFIKEAAGLNGNLPSLLRA